MMTGFFARDEIPVTALPPVEENETGSGDDTDSLPIMISITL
jgi:hypothetical protein